MLEGWGGGHDGGGDEGQRLPADLALKPQVLTTSLYGAQLNLGQQAFARVTFASPPSGQAGTICRVTATIEGFQPLPAPVPNVTVPCVDQSYRVPGGWEPSTACAAGPLGAGHGAVAFTATAVGTQATAAIQAPQFTPTDPVQAGQVTSQQAQFGATFVSVPVTVPQAGTYTFSLAFWQDRSGPSITAPEITETFALGQVGEEWGGYPCTSSTMQAQLPPPSTPATQVICPAPFHP
jgi:hypothetical protein